MGMPEITHPGESYDDRCRQILGKDWTAENVDVAFSQFVSNFALLVSNGDDIGEAVPSWGRTKNQPESNVFGGSFSRWGTKVVVRYLRVDGIDGSNEFSILTNYENGQLLGELLFLSQATRGNVYYRADITSAVMLKGKVLKCAPTISKPEMVREACENVWNLYNTTEGDLEEEDKQERRDRVLEVVGNVFGEPPKLSEANVRKLAKVIAGARKSEFGGHLPNSEVGQLIFEELERSKVMLECCDFSDEAALALWEQEIKYWTRMFKLFGKIRRADVALRQRK